MLECTKCKKHKLPEEMSVDKSRRNGISSWCKDCRKDNVRKWKAKYPDKVEEAWISRINKYRDKPLDSAAMRDYSLKRRYGISQDEYNGILKHQEYCCAICKRDSRDMTYHLHTDHNHTTGVVRGLLCSPCNVYLGYIKDNPDTYQAGIDYIAKTS